MGNWIGLGFILLVVVGVVIALNRLGKPYEVTEEEFDRRVKEGPGSLSVGVIGLQKMLQPGLEKAVEAQQDMRQGYYDGEQESGEGDDTPRNRTDNVETPSTPGSHTT